MDFISVMVSCDQCSQPYRIDVKITLLYNLTFISGLISLAFHLLNPSTAWIRLLPFLHARAIRSPFGCDVLHTVPRWTWEELGSIASLPKIHLKFGVLGTKFPYIRMADLELLKKNANWRCTHNKCLAYSGERLVKRRSARCHQPRSDFPLGSKEY